MRKLVGIGAVVCVFLGSTWSAKGDVHLLIDQILTDATGGSLVIVAEPDPAETFVPGAYAVNLEFDLFTEGIPPELSFDFENQMAEMIELDEVFGTTPHPGVLSDGDVIQLVTAGPGLVDGAGTDLMRLEFTMPEGFDAAQDGFRVSVVPYYPSNPAMVTFVGGDNLILGTAVVGTLPFEPCDLNFDGLCDAQDIDDLSQAIRVGRRDALWDLDGSGSVDDDDRTYWVHSLQNTYLGDSNLDGQFDTSDFVHVMIQGQYEDGIPGNSTWNSGDWNGDAEFDTGDMVAAFQDGGFEQGPRPANAVPEPSSVVLFSVGLLFLAGNRRRRTF